MSPNDLEHNDAEGWYKMTVNYTKRQIAELIDDFDYLHRMIRCSTIADELNEVVVANIISYMCFQLARERERP
ncbi:hypothetical protein H5410_041925 [Solanum commersonii]|uniref:Uncharacterized protein n=1 Tax=Solanum commersonii TaxID=4109 RepID=A0A9J5XSX6_SOLCO|nr:hypothetical protein H5410_041925 [Solanum commersonii]